MGTKNTDGKTDEARSCAASGSVTGGAEVAAGQVWVAKRDCDITGSFLAQRVRVIEAGFSIVEVELMDDGNYGRQRGFCYDFFFTNYAMESQNDKPSGRAAENGGVK